MEEMTTIFEISFILKKEIFLMQIDLKELQMKCWRNIDLTERFLFTSEDYLRSSICYN